MRSSFIIGQAKNFLSGLTLIIFICATSLYCKAGERDGNSISHLTSQMEVALLQCRRAEKNFLLRHDQESLNSFSQGDRTLGKAGNALRAAIKNNTVLKSLDAIAVQSAVYRNAFQDIKGLYNSAVFGPVHDTALSDIPDEVTLLKEPVMTPSSIGATNSLVEAGRNLEYFIQSSEISSHGLIATLNLRRWEKNFQKTSTNLRERSKFYRAKIAHEISKLRASLDDDSDGQRPLLTGHIKLALRRYGIIFNRFAAYNDAFFHKKNEMVEAARSIENNIRTIKKILTPNGNRIFALISEMEISLLQGRRAEKNFLLRKDKESAESFFLAVQALKKNADKIISESQDKSTLSFMDDIRSEADVIENTFRDITGLCNTATFGPVHDPALVRITDQITLMAEPSHTPFRVETTKSLIGAARNLEYLINTLTQSPKPMISLLQARRLEKNFQERYDRLTAATDAKSAFYIKQIRREISNIRDWLNSDEAKIKLGMIPIRLFSALDRYEHNLFQLSRNLDAFYIKRKTLMRSAKSLNRSIQTIKAKLFGIIEQTKIDGLYYLSPKMPVHGQPHGNFHDVGSLVLNPPSNYGYRHCKNWMQFYFDKEGHYTKSNLISSIYFHIWIRTVNNNIDIGYDKQGRYSGGRGGMDDFLSLEYDDFKGYSTINGCSLITGKIGMNYSVTGEDIYKFVIKLSRHSAFPSVVMDPKQYSFIIINPPDDSISKSLDSDNDGLTDYEEMFAYFTNPQDQDTDSDGLSDSAEIEKSTSPNSNDLYAGGIIPGITDAPNIKHYKNIKGDWVVDKEERYSDTKFTIAGNLIIKKTGLLILDGCILELNRGTKKRHAYVGRKGMLIVNNSEINFNDTGYWYKTVEGGNVQSDCDFEICGALTLNKAVIKNSFGIKINEGSKSIINESRLLNYYHLSYDGKSDSKITKSHVSTFIGIPIYCKSSSPIIKNSLIKAEYNGVGIYCFKSSPSIHNSEIIVCEDEDSDSPSIVILNGSNPLISNSRFNIKRVKQDATSSIKE